MNLCFIGYEDSHRSLHIQESLRPVLLMIAKLEKIKHSCSHLMCVSLQTIRFHIIMRFLSNKFYQKKVVLRNASNKIFSYIDLPQFR